MKIGIISDTHDNIPLIEEAVKIFKQENINEVLHAGDLCASITLDPLIKEFKVYFCLGNNDADVLPIKKRLEPAGGVFLNGGGAFVIGGKKFALYHGHNLMFLNALIKSQEFDYVITGHTHKRRNEMVGKTRVINPGSLYPHHQNSVAILDLEKDEVKFVRLGDMK